MKFNVFKHTQTPRGCEVQVTKRDRENRIFERLVKLETRDLQWDIGGCQTIGSRATWETSFFAYLPKYICP